MSLTVQVRYHNRLVRVDMVNAAGERRGIEGYTPGGIKEANQLAQDWASFMACAVEPLNPRTLAAALKREAKKA